MKRKLLTIVVTLVLMIGSIVPVCAGPACETPLSPEEYQNQKQAIIEFIGFDIARGPGGGRVPPPITQ